MNRPAHALEHSTVVLQEAPDHLAALRISAEAAHRIGNDDKAARYRRLLDGLGDVPHPPPVEPELVRLTAENNALESSAWSSEKTGPDAR